MKVGARSVTSGRVAGHHPVAGRVAPESATARFVGTDDAPADSASTDAGNDGAAVNGSEPVPGAASARRSAAALELPPVRAGVTPDGIPRLVRRQDRAVVGGVCSGLAEHLGVKVLWVRLTFALLSVMAGAGVLTYALLWVFVRPAESVAGTAGRTQSAVPGDPGRPRTVALSAIEASDSGIAEMGSAPAPLLVAETSAADRTVSAERRQAIGVAALGVALMIAATALGFGQLLGWVLGPLGLAAVGAAFVWREADDARRARWRQTAVGIVGPRRASWWRLGGGAALVVGGLSVFALGQLDVTAVRSALLAVVLTLVGVAVITIPWWVRLVRDLGTERAARAAAAERAEIAAHLHDSVLQTLALIQRQSGDGREVLRLARGQERELRTWLYGPAGYAGPGDRPAVDQPTVAAALAAAAGEVEDTYAIAVAPVVVGDAVMDPHLAALVAAAREAMVNAAKHAGVDEISVYAEVEGSQVSVFVRDRGRGFDPDAVDTDRRGLTESIRGRMERHGGRAVVRSHPGQGTEIEVSVPIGSSTGQPGPEERQPSGSKSTMAGSVTAIGPDTSVQSEEPVRGTGGRG